MKCKECNEEEIVKLYRKDNVKFVCKKGHVWYEDYEENGGIHSRPKSYEITLEQTLFPSEKVLYKKVLREIENNPWLANATAEDMTSHLVDKCKFDKEELYRLFKKITIYNEKILNKKNH